MPFFHRKPTRFFYPAGLISLVLLPLFGYIYFYQREEFRQNYVIEINYWNPTMANFWGDPRKERSWEVIELDGNQPSDFQKLKKAQLRVKKLISSKDTVNGINLVFGPKSRFGSLIEGFNICQKEKVRYSFASENKIWIFHKNPKSPIVNFEMGPCLLYNDIVIEKPKLTYATIFFN